MADSINIVQREERIPVQPAAASITVVNAGPQGPPGPMNPNAGTPVISGLALRSVAATVIQTGLAGQTVYIDPGTSGQGYLVKLGNDVEHVPNVAQPWLSYQYQINVSGLYHINGHVQQSGASTTATLGSVIGIRVNGTAIRRHSLRSTPWETVNINCVAYLNAGDMVSLFGYTPGTTWTATIQGTQTPTDGYSPRLDVWRVGGAL